MKKRKVKQEKNNHKSLKISCNITNGIHYGFHITDNDTGEIICNNCGVILEEKTISYDVDSANSINKSNGMDSSSSSANQSSSQMTTSSKFIPVSTSIGKNAKSFGTKDHTGKMIPTAIKNTLKRLYNSGQIQRTRSGDINQRGLISGMIKLDSMVSKLALNHSVHQDTALLYKKASNLKLVRGRTVTGMVAACLYHTCKQAGIPRDMAEISLAANVDKKILFRTYRSLVNGMELYGDVSNENDSSISLQKQTNAKRNHQNYHHQENKNQNDDDAKTTIAKQRHIKLIPKIASKLQLPQRIHRQAVNIILNLDNFTLSGKNPNVIAASAIYIACMQDEIQNYSITQHKVSGASRITEVSIRNFTKLIKSTQEKTKFNL